MSCGRLPSYSAAQVGTMLASNAVPVVMVELLSEGITGQSTRTFGWRELDALHIAPRLGKVSPPASGTRRLIHLPVLGLTGIVIRRGA